jgi:prephenate dehydrogenase
MPEPDFLADMHIVILGLGLMGGSLAMALQGRCRALDAADPDPAVLEIVRRQKVVDRFSPNPSEILPEADLVILAAPVRAILGLIRELPALHPGSPVVIDLGSTKTQICHAFEELPARFDPLGGHPMCGKETGTLVNADPMIYQGAPFAFTSLQRTSSRAHSLAEQLAHALGSNPIWLDPETHDLWTASTSHLPYLISAILANTTPHEAAPLVGSGFRSTARLAGTPITMMMDVLATNENNILDALDKFQYEFERVRAQLAQGDYHALGELLSLAAANHRDLVSPNAPGNITSKGKTI